MRDEHSPLGCGTALADSPIANTLQNLASPPLPSTTIPLENTAAGFDVSPGLSAPAMRKPSNRLTSLAGGKAGFSMHTTPAPRVFASHEGHGDDQEGHPHTTPSPEEHDGDDDDYDDDDCDATIHPTPTPSPK